MIDVSVIIVSFNTLSMTGNCIESIVSKTTGLNYEIILVDNASTDGSKEFFETDGRIRYIYNEENLGFGRANNKGLEVAKGRNVLFLNSDTLLRNNAIKILSDFLDSCRDAGACGGNLFAADGTPNYSFGMYFPSVRQEFDLLLRNVLCRNEMSFNDTGHNLRVAHVLGADMMVKSSVLKEVGPYNPRFFMYYEETELCFRIAKAGYSIYSVPQAEITHFWGATTRPVEQEERYIIRKEQSRTVYYSLTHSRTYFRFVNFVRDIAIASKMLSPSASVRRRWRWRRDIYRRLRDNNF